MATALSGATISQRWREVFNGHTNFMTPDVVKLDQSRSGDYLYELATGRDMDGRPMYGVTVVALGGYGRRDEHDHDKSKLFQGSRAKLDALRYIRSL